jgi:hypothetical protein
MDVDEIKNIMAQNMSSKDSVEGMVEYIFANNY